MEKIQKRIQVGMATCAISLMALLVLSVIYGISDWQLTPAVIGIITVLILGVFVGLFAIFGYSDDDMVAYVNTTNKILDNPQLRFGTDGEFIGFARNIFEALKKPSIQKNFALQYFGNTCERARLELFIDWCHSNPTLISKSELNDVRRCRQIRFQPPAYDVLATIQNFDYTSPAGEMDVACAIKTYLIYTGLTEHFEELGKAVHLFLKTNGVPEDMMIGFITKLDKRLQIDDIGDKLCYTLIKTITKENNPQKDA